MEEWITAIKSVGNKAYYEVSISSFIFETVPVLNHASTLTQKVTGPVGSVTRRIYWFCKILTCVTLYICIVFAFVLGCKFLLRHEAKYCYDS